VTLADGPIVVQIVGYKKSGKTTLVCRLVEHFSAMGMKVATIKHDAHGFEPDVPGTDSWKHRQSGARWSAVVSPARTAYFEERESDADELIARMKDAGIVLLEGFKRKPYPKLALIQSAEHLPLLDSLEAVAAVATWADREREPWVGQLAQEGRFPVLPYGDTVAISNIVLNCGKRL
jgi:molybdopterin-guanine dinucleotide biosynthesis adapter protein